MTGNILRDKVHHEFTSMKEIESTITQLNKEPEKRSHKLLATLIEIVKQMKFFQD